MSVQSDCVFEPGPQRVRTTIAGTEFVADVVDREFVASYAGYTGDILTLSIENGRYRKRATECDPV